MCYYFSQTKGISELQKKYEIQSKHTIAPQYAINGFTFPKILAITNDNPKELTELNWGLIPSWVKSQEQANTIRSKTLNAKSETVFELPSFKNSILTKRCLILASGFYEWMSFRSKKYPFFIALKENDPFAFAGIWDTNIDKNTGEVLQTCSILTCEANPLMAKIHNTKKRMPVMLPVESEQDWLSPSLKKTDIVELLQPYPEDKMQAHTISRLISSRTENTNVSDVLEEVTYKELENIET